VDCSTLWFCDDFETDPVGGRPSSERWSVESPDCSGDGQITVTDEGAHSGSRAIEVTGSGGYCNHVFMAPTSDIADLGDVVHARFYVRLDEPLGAGHVTFLAFHDASDDRDLRMGGQSEILMWNREIDDATLPELSPTGIALSTAPVTGTWTCIEVEVDSSGTLQTWVDGSLVAGLIIDGAPTADIDSQWLRSAWTPELTDARFGWESYGGGGAAIFFDDVALSSEPIGCMP
jgi:hypothetical protein